jgi:hypothetical protein
MKMSDTWAGQTRNPNEEETVRKVVVSMNVALDGVIEAPERWSFRFWSDELSESALEEPLEWSNSTLIEGDVAEEVAKLKWGSGKDILVFSADLARTLTGRDLVAEYRLRVAPVIARRGKRLIGDGVDMKTMRLVGTRAFDTGVVGLTYQSTRDNQ